jgi:hypothetical protein
MIMTVIFENGFSILDTLEQVFGVMQQEKKIEVKGFFTAEAAYVYGCEQYVRRWLTGGNSNQLPLPRFDDLLKAGGTYINPLTERLIDPIKHVDSNGEAIRFFSLVAPFTCACICGVYNVMAAILENNISYFCLCEFRSPEEVQKYVIFEYRVQQMSIGAYLEKPIYLPDALSINELFFDVEINSTSQQIKEIKGFIG